MRFRDLMREVFSALDANRGRSLLTILGIVIGIAAVIAMTSLIGGVSQALVGELGLDQARMLYISGSTPTRELDEADLEQIELNVPGYDFVTGLQYSSANISGGTKTEEGASLLCVEATYFDAGTVNFIAGSSFTDRDASAGSMVIVLSQPVAKKLYGGDGSDAVGKSVKIGNDSFTVVGVAEAANAYQAENYVPYKTAVSRLPDVYDGYAQVIGCHLLVHYSRDVESVTFALRPHVAVDSPRLIVSAFLERKPVTCLCKRRLLELDAGKGLAGLEHELRTKLSKPHGLAQLREGYGT